MSTLACGQCEREVIRLDDGTHRHKDGRIKHPIPQVVEKGIPVASVTEKAPPVLQLEVEEDEMAPRTRTTTPDGETYTAVLDPADPEDESLVQTAMEVFEDMDPELGDITEVEPLELPDEAVASAELSEAEVVESVRSDRQTHPATDDEEQEAPSRGTPEGPADNRINPNFGKPRPDKMVTVRGGGLYLRARDRITWMRGEPVPHPDWTIDTYAEEIERGEFKGNNNIEGGYARYRSNIFDAEGRLIGTGTKTEFSERFMDFAEKAETGAIARALAVCGYGTEAALDLDEGVDQDRIADAPVTDSRPINITPSDVGGLVQGGRSENITKAQYNEITRLIAQAAMGMTLVPFIESVLGDEKSVPDLGEDPTTVIVKFLNELSFEEAAKLIQALNKVIHDAADTA